MSKDEPTLTFGLTPLFVTRQHYYALEQGIVEPDGVDLELEYYHSPEKDHVLLCGAVDFSTLSMGKYILAKTISDTYTLPTDPFAVATGLTYQQGNGLFVHADGDVDEPADLVGKRLGIHDKSMVYVYHNAILEQLYDVPVDEIEWVFDTHQGLTERMANGDLDAVERVGDWYWNLMNSPDHRMLYDMADGWNELEGYDPIVHVVCVDNDVRERYPAAVDSVVETLQASEAHRDEHLDDILQAFLEEAEGQSEWEGELTFDALKRSTSSSYAPFTMTEPQRQNFRDWMDYAIEYNVMAKPVADERLYPL